MSSPVPSQNERIKQHLEEGKTITPLGALRHYGCLRLGARIYDLKHKQGMNIQSRLIHFKGHHFSEYSLQKQNHENIHSH